MLRRLQLSTLLAVLLAALVLPGSAPADVEFREAPGSPFLASAFPGGGVAGDFTNDGKIDLVVLGHGTVGPTFRTLTLLKGDGKGGLAFGAKTDATTFDRPDPDRMLPVDFNRDGLLDIAARIEPGSGGGGSIVLFDNKGDGTFGSGEVPLDSLGQARDIAVGQFDGAEGDDIAAVMVGHPSGAQDTLPYLRIYSGGPGGPTPTTPHGFMSVDEIDPKDLATGDFNRDGAQDFLVGGDRYVSGTGCCKGRAVMVPGPVSKLARGARVVAEYDLPPRAVFAGDWGGDHTADWAVLRGGGDETGSRLEVFANRPLAPGTLIRDLEYTSATITGGAGWTRAVPTDLNHDGAQDLAVLDVAQAEHPRLQRLLGVMTAADWRTQTLEPGTPSAVDYGFQPRGAADFDGNRVPDLIGESGEGMRLYLGIPVRIDFRHSRFTEREGPPGVGHGTIDFEIKPSATREKVDYATSDGGDGCVETRLHPAVAGIDYSRKEGQLTLEPGKEPEPVKVPILDDKVYRGARCFTLTLTYADGETRATGVKEEDDECKTTAALGIARLAYPSDTPADTCFLTDPTTGDVSSESGKPVLVNGILLKPQAADAQLTLHRDAGTLSSGDGLFAAELRCRECNQIPAFPFSAGTIDWNLKPDGDKPIPVDLGPPNLHSFLGLTVNGDGDVTLTGDGTAAVDFGISLPVFGGATLTIETDQVNGLRLGALDAEFPNIGLHGEIGLQDTNLHYDSGKDQWKGGTKVVFPPGGSVGGDFSVDHGQLSGLHIDTDFAPPIPLGPSGVFLTGIHGAGFSHEDPFNLPGVKGEYSGHDCDDLNEAIAAGDLEYDGPGALERTMKGSDLFEIGVPGFLKTDDAHVTIKCDPRVLRVEPPLQIGGHVALAAGPRVQVPGGDKESLLNIEGGFEYSGEENDDLVHTPWSLLVDGTVSIGKLSLTKPAHGITVPSAGGEAPSRGAVPDSTPTGHGGRKRFHPLDEVEVGAYIRYVNGQSVSFGAGLSKVLPSDDFRLLSIRGDLNGTIVWKGLPPATSALDPNARAEALRAAENNVFLEADMTGEACIWVPKTDIHGCAGAGAGISNRGVAACAIFEVVGIKYDSGVAYYWNDRSTQYFSGCGHEKLASILGALRAASVKHGPTSFRVPAKLHDELVEVSGTEDAPVVTLVGPDGRRVTTSDNGHLDKQFFYYKDPRHKKTFIQLGHPPAGRWTLRPAEGSSPIADIRLARSVPPTTIRAQVTGSGARRKLVYRVSRRADQKVRFVSVAPDGAEQLIGSVDGGGRGVKRFVPAPAPAGVRKVRAYVERDGLRVESRIVARYGTIPIHLHAPHGVRVRMRWKTMTIRWKKVLGAAGYVIEMRQAGHGTRTRRVKGHRTRYVFRRFDRYRAGSVNVAAIGADGSRGPARHRAFHAVCFSRAHSNVGPHNPRFRFCRAVERP